MIAFIKKNSKIIIIFLIYILSHLIFAKWYHSIYKSDPNHFLITEEIIRSQKKTIEEDVNYRSGLTKLTIESLQKKKETLKSFIESVIKKSKNEELALSFLNGHIYKFEDVIYVCSFKGREIVSDVTSFKLEVYEKERLRNSYLFEVGVYKIEDLEKIDISKLFSKKVNQLSQEIELTKSNIKKIENEKDHLWSYSDFIYFSTGYISGDIIPNSSKIRRLVLFQRVVEAILFLLLINLTFKFIEPKKTPEKQQVKNKIIALNKNSIIILDLLREAKKLPLNDLKTQAGLSNKKWDKAIKELTKNKLAKVEKTEEELFVELV